MDILLFFIPVIGIYLLIAGLYLIIEKDNSFGYLFIAVSTFMIILPPIAAVDLGKNEGRNEVIQSIGSGTHRVEVDEIRITHTRDTLTTYRLSEAPVE